jgi:hypothetical protein
MSRRPQIFGKTLFVDLMMSTLVVVTALLVASNALERAEKEKKEIEKAKLATDGKYAVVMEWPNGSTDDIDLYVRDPKGNIAFFSARDVGLMHLEHDDQGMRSDFSSSASGDVRVERNEERTILRGTFPGEYVVNVHMYGKHDRSPTPVTIRLYFLQGEDAAVIEKVRTLAAGGDEQTAFRFTLDAAGNVTDVNELPRPLTGAAGKVGP